MWRARALNSALEFRRSSLEWQRRTAARRARIKKHDEKVSHDWPVRFIADQVYADDTNEEL
jgi:hypothetical protein